MSFYQQNNTSIRITSIQIANVIFTQVAIDSNINNLLSRLKVCFEELERLIRFKASVDDVKRKAIEANSTATVLMSSINEVELSQRDDFSKKLIESCALIIEMYEDAEGKLGLNAEISNDLAAGCISFFNSQLGRYLNDSFWFDLKYYEWLLKEGFVSNNRYMYKQRRERYFSDECLEKFFGENRGWVLRRMLSENTDHDRHLMVSDPLDDVRANTSFQAYKMLPQAI